MGAALGRAFDRSTQLNTELGLPPFASVLPSRSLAAMAEQNARNPLRAQGEEDLHHMRPWQKTS